MARQKYSISCDQILYMQRIDS